MRGILLTIGCVTLLAAAPAVAAPADPPPLRVTTSPGVDLGMRVEQSADRRFVRVAALAPRGAASGAGIEIGDVIVALDGRPVRNPNAVAEHLAGVAPGRPVQVDLQRRGRGERLFIAVDAAALIAAHDTRRVTTPAIAPLGTLGELAAAPADVPAGVRFVPLSAGLGRYFGTDRGVLVVQAARDNPLRLEDGDVLQAVDGQRPVAVDDALELLDAAGARGRAVLDVWRERRSRRFEVALPATAPSLRRERRADPSSSPRHGD